MTLPRENPVPVKASIARSAIWSANLLLYASVQFVVLTIAAMLLYPGSAKYTLQSDHYSFFDNFFSDLGATKTYAGYPNTSSQILFIIALGSQGLAFLSFSRVWRVVAARRSQARFLGYLSQSFAIFSGLCFIGIAATPWDLLLDAHNKFVKAAFTLLLGFILSLTCLQIRNSWQRWGIALNFLYLVILAIYVLILFFGPDLTTQSGLKFQVAAQKIIVYVSVINLALQAVGIRQGALNNLQ